MHFINAILTLLLLFTLSNKAGIVSILYIRFIGLLILSILIILNANKIWKRWKEDNLKTVIPEFILLLLPIILFLMFENNYLWLTSLPLFILGILGIRSTKKGFLGVHVTSLLYLLFILTVENISGFWKSFENSSLLFTNTLSKLFKTDLLLGPSVSGLYGLIILLTFLIINAFISKIGFIALIKYLVVLLIVHSSLLIFHGHFFGSAYLLSNYQFLFFIIGLTTITFFVKRMDFSETLINTGRKLNLSLKTQTLLIFLVLILGFCWSFLLFIYPTLPTKDNGILFYQHGPLNWGTPNFVSYSLLSGGMYGMLPKYLEALGYKTEITEDLTEEKLSKNKVLVMIVPNKEFSEVTMRKLWEWVRVGGSLLLLGDHTDIFDFMKPTNNLLNPFGVQYKFDTADPSTRGMGIDLAQGIWTNQIEIKSHPITHSLHGANSLQIGGGASLDIFPPAYPIILGKYGFSDPGDYENKGRGGYLGNRIYERGERLGDLVLVGGRDYGKGKVIVFGDTSTFQNIALPYTYRFVNQIFSYLTAKPLKVVELLTPFRLLGVLLFFSVFLLIILIKEYNFFKIFVVVLSGAITWGIFCAGFVNEKMVKMEDKQISGETAYILTSHSGQFNKAPFTDNSTDALSLNLMRNGFLPVVSPHFDRERMAKSKVLVFIAPTKPLRSREASFLKEYMERGGLVVLSAGYFEKENFLPLLKDIGLDIEPLPLGSLPLREYENPAKYYDEAKFLNAWPVKVEDESESNIIYKCEVLGKKYPIVVSSKVGKGNFLLISDSEFLLNKNVETERGFWRGNILLIKRIIEDLKR